MSVNQDAWWGETMTLTATNDSSTEVIAAGLQNVSVSATGEHTTLYTADSVKREDVRRGQMAINVEFEYALWDISFAKSWLGTGESNTSIEDTSEVPLFTVTGGLENAQGDEIEVEIIEVYFPELDIFEASMGEYVSKNQSGEGSDVNITETENV